jgi:hypothetical protein
LKQGVTAKAIEEANGHWPPTAEINAEDLSFG